MNEKNLKKRKSKIFVLFMLLYVCIWLSATLIVDGMVWDKAQNYQENYDKAKEKSQPERFMDGLVQKVDAKKLAVWLGENGNCSISGYSAFDEYEKYFEQIIGNSEITYKKTDMKNVYDILTDKEVVARVKIGSDNKYDKYNFHGWKFVSADVLSYMYETFSKTIVADKNYTVYVNGKPLTSEYLIKEKVTVMGKYMTGITGEKYGTNIYKVDGFLVEPEIYAVDRDGNNVENTSMEIDMAEFVENEIKVMTDAQKSRVSDTFHIYFEHMNKLKKYEAMKEYLVEGTDAYNLIAAAQKSLEWVTPVKKITISKEIIDDYKQYGDKYFSCSLYMDVLKDYGYTTKNEYFDASVLFKKVGNQWYLDTFILNEQ